MWRLYDSATGLHLWTTDAWERRVLLTQRRGWSDEGLAWYGAGPYRMSRLYDPKTQQPATIPQYWRQAIRDYEGHDL